MLFYGMMGVIIGGRLGEVLFYEPVKYFSDPIEIFKVWHGGMSFHGGFLGVLIAMSLWARKSGRNLLDVYDFIAPLVPLGYAAGRMGNFINAELPGRVVSDQSLPWAMLWPDIRYPLHPDPVFLQGLRHPSPIYQMLIDGLLVFVLLWNLRPARSVHAWRWAPSTRCCTAARASSPSGSARRTGRPPYSVCRSPPARCCRCR